MSDVIWKVDRKARNPGITQEMTNKRTNKGNERM
jgi:hypothetical protein